MDHLVAQQHGRVGDVSGDESEVGGHAIREEAFAGAGHRREHDQAIFIDEMAGGELVD